MKFLFGLVALLYLGVLGNFTHAQTLVNQSQGERIVFQGQEGKPQTIEQSFQFKGKFHKNIYSEETEKVGLRFQNGTFDFRGNITNTPMANNQVFEESWHDSPVVTLYKAKVNFFGLWEAKNNYCKPILNLLKGSEFHFQAGSHINLVFPAYGNFTRQLWVRSDGSGKLFLHKGFIADRSLRGKLDDACGSIRFHDAQLITYDSAALPTYFRPEPKDPSKAEINSHLVFEKASGKSIWQHTGEAANFIGGLWTYDSTLIIRCEKDLKFTGKYAYWSDYVNYGGLIFANQNIEIRKTGPADLMLACETFIPKGATLKLEEGSLSFGSKIWSGKREKLNIAPKGTNLQNGPHLNFIQSPKTTTYLSTDTLHIAQYIAPKRKGVLSLKPEQGQRLMLMKLEQSPNLAKLQVEIAPRLTKDLYYFQVQAPNLKEAYLPQYQIINQKKTRIQWQRISDNTFQMAY